MPKDPITEAMLRRFAIRIEPEMSRYAQTQINGTQANTFPVMGVDARTGVPVRAMIDADALRSAAQQAISA